jgi:NAD(P)-dependent dehydrogenase (short-subunit alcohol dehydrogenase family)
MNKICLITGGNAGIGKATATALAKQGYQVVIVSRSQEKAEEAIKDIKFASNNQQVHYIVADLGSLQSVRELAAEYRQQYDRLDVLVNNAGAFFSDLGYTVDKIERQFAINHLAPFLLTNLLLDTLKKSAPARIVNVASEAHYRGKINFDDLYHEKDYDGFFKAYSQSKLANVLFTNELSRRLEGTGVTANSLHPGVVSTGIASKNASGLYKLVWGLARAFMITTEQGAMTSVYLASSPEVEGISGKYFDKCKQKKPSDTALDPQTAAKLWQVSEKLVGLGQ